MNITEFLEARIAEDEAYCKGMLRRVPTPDDSLENSWDFAYAERVLAECAAKRAIMAHWGPFETLDGPNLLTVLATVYKDYPDYQQEWV